MLRLGNKEVVDLKVGARQAVAAYLGSELVWQKSAPLPYDYAVEYIQAGTTTSERFWVDTGVYAKGTPLGTRIKCANTLPGNDRWAFGRYDGSNARDYIIGQHSGGWRWFVFNSRVTLSNSYDSNPHEITVNIDNKCTFDGTTVYEGTKSISEEYGSNYTLGIFSLSDTISISNAGTRLYYLQLFRDGQMIRDYIPCVKNGVACLYEAVAGEFKYNERTGMGDFIAGPRKE